MITVGRITGWVIFFASIMIAFAETVLAYNNVNYSTIPTSELWVLIAGRSLDVNNVFLAMVMQSPLWVFTGTVGILFIVFCKKERQKSSFE